MYLRIFVKYSSRSMTLIILCLLVGCRQQPTPDEVHPDLAGVITYLREWKDSCEGMAQNAQNSKKLIQPHGGENLYLAAMVTHNGAIEKIISALNLDLGAVKISDIQNALEKSDDDARAFCAWYGEHFERKKAGRCESAAGADEITGLLQLIIDAIKIQDQRDTEQRKALIEQLKESRMKSWANLAGDNGAEQ